MAKKTVIVSDLTGTELNSNAAQVKINLASKPGSTFSLEVAEGEIAELLAHATEHKRRGRKAKV